MTDKNQGITIKKASGETEPFEASKLIQSLQRAGADEKAAQEITGDIKNWLTEGVSTKKIYARAFRLLRRKNNLHAVRYKLKRALYELGPTGYPFEHLLGEILKRKGYRVEVGKVVGGRCITHEMDVIATGNKEQLLVECKYSKDQGKHVSIQVPLYVRARIDDIVMKRKEMEKYRGYSFSGWIVTNTRFTSDSIDYARCSGLHILGWDYPSGNGLKEWMEKEKIFPLSILTQLTRNQKDRLMEKGLVTCLQLHENLHALDEFGLSDKKLKPIRNELEQVLND
ncbi:MAG: restriction endonuclease [Bacteroidales bacterium]